jgi:hypothetical protein
LFEASVEVEAHAADEQVRHPDHEINAVVIGAGFPERVVIGLRTGGQEGVLSVWTGQKSARRDERDDEGRDEEQQSWTVDREPGTGEGKWCQDH